MAARPQCPAASQVMTDSGLWYKYLNFGHRLASHDCVAHTAEEYVRGKAGRRSTPTPWKAPSR